MNHAATLFALLLASGATAQHLRHAIADSPVVITGKHVGVQPLGNDLFLHRIEVVEALKGEADGRLTIVEKKRIADLPKPTVDPRLRLYCLRESPRPDLPERFGPYYKLGGYRGDSPVLSDPVKDDPYVRFAQILIRSEAGTGPQETADALVKLALESNSPVRVEAIEVLRTRTIVRDKLSPFALDRALARAVGETEDVPYKIALASLCGEMRMDGVVRALCLSFDKVPDPRYAQTVGRLAAFLHGEDAFTVLSVPLQQARTDRERGATLLALGATRTDKALDALLRIRRMRGDNDGHIDAALRANGSKRALEAAGKK